MRKRLLKCLVVVFLVQTAFLGIGGAAEEAHNDYKMYVDLLTSLSVVDGTYDAIFKEDNYVSREVVNHSIASLNYEHNDSARKTEITEMEYIKLLVDYLGYDKVLSGKTDQDYLAKAISIDLTKGMDINPENKLTGYVFAKLMTRALETPQFGMSSNGVWEEGKSYFEKKDIISLTGTVETTEYASCVYDNPCSEGYVEISGVTYATGELDINDYLGFMVNAYAKEQDGVYTLLGVSAHKKNKVLELDAEKIISSDSTTVTYYSSNDKKKTVRLKSDYTLIYNGMTMFKHSDNVLEPELGNIILIDSEGDGTYETAKVTDYEIYVVSGIDTTQKLIYAESGIYFSYDSDNVSVISSNIDGEFLDLSKVKAKDVLYVALSQDKKCVQVSGSRQTVKGNLGGTKNVEDYIEATFDGKKYLVNNALSGELIVGSFYVGYMGPDGTIQKLEITRNEFYAILEKAWTDDTEEEKYLVMFFDQDGREKTYVINEKAKLFSPAHSGVTIGANEVSYIQNYIKAAFETQTTEYGYGMAAPIITYSLRNDEINTIGIPQVRPEGVDATERPEGALWSATTLTDFVNVRTRNYWRASTRFFAPNYAGKYCDQAYKRPTDDTVIFTVRLNGNEQIPVDIAENTTVKIGGYSSSTWIHGSFYNLDSDMGLGAMIKYETSEASLESSDGFIVESVGTALNADDETCVMLTGYDKKGEKTLVLSPDATISATYINAFLKEDISSINQYDIKSGDYIIYNEKDGEVISLALMMSASRPESDYSMLHNGNGYESYFEMVYGKVIAKSPNVLYVEITNTNYNASEKVHYVFGYKQAGTLIYDRASGTADKISADSLNIGDTVFVRKLPNANVGSILKVIN